MSTTQKLTAMQAFFLDFINGSKEKLNPSYLAQVYYNSIGKHRCADSRGSFGQTSAAYRTCRFLASQGLINEHNYKTSGGYSYAQYSKLD